MSVRLGPLTASLSVSNQRLAADVDKQTRNQASSSPSCFCFNVYCAICSFCGYNCCLLCENRLSKNAYGRLFAKDLLACCIARYPFVSRRHPSGHGWGVRPRRCAPYRRARRWRPSQTEGRSPVEPTQLLAGSSVSDSRSSLTTRTIARNNPPARLVAQHRRAFVPPSCVLATC